MTPYYERDLHGYSMVYCAYESTFLRLRVRNASHIDEPQSTSPVHLRAQPKGDKERRGVPAENRRRAKAGVVNQAPTAPARNSKEESLRVHDRQSRSERSVGAGTCTSGGVNAWSQDDSGGSRSPHQWRPLRQPTRKPVRVSRPFSSQRCSQIAGCGAPQDAGAWLRSVPGWAL